MLFQINKYKLRIMKRSRYFLDCVISEKLTISFVLRQQKYVTRKSDKFAFVATDAANIYVDTSLSTGILMTKFKCVLQ